jgi:heptosyltransferase-2
MERILVTPLVGMGDMIMTTPALRLLKEAHPDWHVTVMTFSGASRDLLEQNPHIDRLDFYPLTEVGALRGVFHILRKYGRKYTTCINFYPSNRKDYNIFALLSLAPRRIGHAYLHMNFSQLNWLKTDTITEDPGAHCVEENVRLLSLLGLSVDLHQIPPMEIFLTPEELAGGKAFRDGLNSRRVVGIHAGTSTFKGHGRRRWPAERFSELIDRFPRVHFLLFGTREEAEVNEAIRAAVQDPSHVTVVENRPIREVAAIIGAADAFVSNDSGLMHLAAAMRRPVLAILGPTNPAYIRPWGVSHEVLRIGLPCSPCFYYSPRPLQCRLNNSFKCLRDISVEMAEAGLKKLL